jgi:multidrug efflux pump subunit AcrA (membrane-fusion protein)
MAPSIRLLPLVLAACASSAWAQFGPLKVVTATAQVRELPATIDVVGTVEPLTRSALGAEVAGLVLDMPARQGDRVEKGQLLCKLNDDLLRLRIGREEARLAALQAALDELVNGTRPEQLAWLKAELEAAQATAARWTFELERIKRLLGSDYANQREFQDALAEQRAAEERMNSAKARYDEGLAGPRKEVIDAARFAVEEQRATVELLKTELAKTEIRAPFSGYVSNRYAEVGNWVAVGQTVLELVDLSEVLVRVNAPEHTFPYAVVGAHAAIAIDALGQRFDGTIRHAVPQADLAARTFPVDIAVPNPDVVLKAGMFARATIPAGAVEKHIAVPKDALIDIRGTTQVALVVPAEQGPMGIPTPVTLGADDGTWIAITSGNVPEGSQVVIYGNERLFFPQPVLVVSSKAEADAPAVPAPPAGAAPQASSTDSPEVQG